MTPAARRALLKLAPHSQGWVPLAGSRIYPNTVTVLRDLGLVVTNDEGQIRLTTEGQRIAARLAAGRTP